MLHLVIYMKYERAVSDEFERSDLTFSRRGRERALRALHDEIQGHSL